MTTLNYTDILPSDNVTKSFGYTDDNVRTTRNGTVSTTSSYFSTTTSYISSSLETSHSTNTYSDDNQEFLYYTYAGYHFERPAYLYIWELLVIITCLVNILVLSILLRKHMRNATNVILAAIAITDSLTGLCTLPTYIMVYMSNEIPDMYKDTSYYEYNNNGTSNHVDYPNTYYDHHNYNYEEPATANVTSMPQDEYMHADDFFKGQDIYYISKSLCQWFMTSKLFLSKSFHTMSIFLTLCLGVHRFISVAAPFKARLLTTTNALITCLIVVVVSPLLHVYHFSESKTQYGSCQWEMNEDGCKGGCAYLWITFLLRQFIPCTVLLIFTCLFIYELRKSMVTAQGMVGKKDQMAKRNAENRRVAFIVTFVVVIFLIAEIPYGVFTFYNAIDKSVSNGENIDLKRNRSIHLAYEILLVLSFHANFYVYTLFNRKFRQCLKQMFRGDFSRRPSVSVSSQRTVRQTEMISMRSKMSTENTAQSSSNSVIDKPGTESNTML
ncbi:hypothetical protein ACF0H5_016015 [Mactra antiquata]